MAIFNLSPGVDYSMSRRLTQTVVFEEDTGLVLSETIRSGSTSNGKGWIIMYTEKVTELILKCPSAATLKVFMLLSMGQQFEERGMVTTKKAVQEKLGITKPTCLEAFKWLKENFIINESKVNGCTEFMINPAYVTVGRDKKKRMQEWTRRWAGQTVKTLPFTPAKSLPKPKSGRTITMD